LLFVKALQRQTDSSNKMLMKKHLKTIAMYSYIPRSLAMRAFTVKGVIHKNPSGRAVTTRLHATIVTMSGAVTVLSLTANRAFRQRVLLAAAKCLEGANRKTRDNAQEIVTFLTTDGGDWHVESHGTQTRERLRCRRLAATVNYRRILSPERAPHINKPQMSKDN
jgi:hypothetical protein